MVQWWIQSSLAISFTGNLSSHSTIRNSLHFQCHSHLRTTCWKWVKLRWMLKGEFWLVFNDCEFSINSDVWTVILRRAFWFYSTQFPSKFQWHFDPFNLHTIQLNDLDCEKDILDHSDWLIGWLITANFCVDIVIISYKLKVTLG